MCISIPFCIFHYYIYIIYDETQKSKEYILCFIKLFE